MVGGVLRHAAGDTGTIRLTDDICAAADVIGLRKIRREFGFPATIVSSQSAFALGGRGGRDQPGGIRSMQGTDMLTRSRSGFDTALRVAMLAEH